MLPDVISGIVRLFGPPVCRDPADQKFLELARDCEADFLVTKDRALLALARRQDPALSFRIVTPEQLREAISKT